MKLDNEETRKFIQMENRFLSFTILQCITLQGLPSSHQKKIAEMQKLYETFADDVLIM